SVAVDYPPTRCTAADDPGGLRGQRVLMIEDDVIGGRTLRLVVDYLRPFGPEALGLYLGHTKGIQQPRNVPAEVAAVYVFAGAAIPGATGVLFALVGVVSFGWEAASSARLRAGPV